MLSQDLSIGPATLKSLGEKGNEGSKTGGGYGNHPETALAFIT